jgi:hypothetical protein
MTIIDNDKCLVVIRDLYEPIGNWFERENKMSTYTPEFITEGVNLCKTEPHILHYARRLDSSFKNQALVIVCLKELFSYMKGEGDVTYDIYQLHLNLKSFIYEPIGSTVA